MVVLKNEKIYVIYNRETKKYREASFSEMMLKINYYTEEIFAEYYKEGNF